MGSGSWVGFCSLYKRNRSGNREASGIEAAPLFSDCNLELESSPFLENIVADQQPMLTAVFRDRHNASHAHLFLIQRGFTASDINVLMSNTTRQLLQDDPRHNVGSLATEGVATGGAIGTGIGAGLAAIAAIGTSVVFPGLGLIVAGPLLAAFAGGGAGAVAGGILGGLIGAGIPESNAEAYEEVLKSGGVVIGVTPRNDDERLAIQDRFDELNAENIVVATV